MPIADSDNAVSRVHSVNIDNRERMNLCGIDDVKGFDENIIVLNTCQGCLTIRGENLHIDKIDLDVGKISLGGHIQELSYDEISTGGFFSRLFG